MLATAIIGSMVGRKYAIRSNARPGSASFTASAISSASTIEAGMVARAYTALLRNACQNTGSSSRPA